MMALYFFADKIVCPGVFIKCLWIQIFMVAYNLLSSTPNTAIFSSCFVALQTGRVTCSVCDAFFFFFFYFEKIRHFL